MTDIRAPKSPNLLIPTPEYDRLYQQQMNDALRLYFAQIDNASAQTLRDVADLSVLEWLEP